MNQNDREKKSFPLGHSLRHWRQLRNLSQLRLALDADFSARHLSFIKTGKTQPSRQVVLQLAQVLRRSLRQRNALLLAVGYAPEYRVSTLDGPRMAVVQEMTPPNKPLSRMLIYHESE